MPLTATVLDVAQRYPDRIAIAGCGRSLTYSELVADSRHLPAAVSSLQDAQAAPPTPARESAGIPITAVSSTSAFHTARIIGGLAGFPAVTATIDPRWPLEHRVGVIVTTGIGVVVTDSGPVSGQLRSALADAGWGGTVIDFDDLRAAECAATPAPPPTARDGDEPFLMLFSSGTTENPKAFVKTREQYRQNVAVSSAHLEPLPGVATLAPGPVSYSLTLYAVIESLATGGSVHVADSFDPIAVGKTIESHGITRVVAVPAMVSALVAAARRNPERFASLNLIVTGGANFSHAMRASMAATLPNARVISYYGAAEIGFIGDSRSGDGTLITLYPEIGARLCRDDGSEIGLGDEEIGTIWIRAAACSDSYVTGTTTEVLRDADGWATVHDQGRWVGRGLQLLGRAGDIAITGGHKVALTQVERAVAKLADGHAVCAVALPDPRRGSLIALVIEARPDTALTKAKLVAAARESLAPQFVPRRWYLVPALPRTVGGKIRRAATADMLLAAIDSDDPTVRRL